MWRYSGQDRACEAVEVLVGVEAWLVKPAVVMAGDSIVARVRWARATAAQRKQTLRHKCETTLQQSLDGVNSMSGDGDGRVV